MVKFIVFFSIIQLINVILNTFRTCVTAKGNKIAATLITAVCYGFYTFVIVFTADSVNLWLKAGITVATNLVGVYLSMFILEKLKKDKLWEIVATIAANKTIEVTNYLTEAKIGYQVSPVNGTDYMVYHIFSKTQKESLIIKKALQNSQAKYIVHEENAKL